MKKLIFSVILGVLFNPISQATTSVNLSDGTVLEFPDGTNKNVINTSSQEVIQEKNKRLKDLDVLASKYGARAINKNAEKVKIIAPWEKPTLQLVDKTSSIYRFTNNGDREISPNANPPKSFKLEKPKSEQGNKKSFSFEEAFPTQNSPKYQGGDEKNLLSSIKGVFGPNNAVECAQKYFPKIKFPDAQDLIQTACGVWFLQNDLDSNVRSAGKCIAKNTSDIYSAESGLRVISDCSKGNTAIYAYFESLLMDDIVDKVNQQMRRQVQREVDRKKESAADAPVGPIYMYDAATGTNKYCYQNGAYLNCY